MSKKARWRQHDDTLKAGEIKINNGIWKTTTQLQVLVSVYVCAYEYDMLIIINLTVGSINFPFPRA